MDRGAGELTGKTHVAMGLRDEVLVLSRKGDGRNIGPVIFEDKGKLFGKESFPDAALEARGGVWERPAPPNALGNPENSETQRGVQCHFGRGRGPLNQARGLSERAGLQF